MSSPQEREAADQYQEQLDVSEDVKEAAVERGGMLTEGQWQRMVGGQPPPFPLWLVGNVHVLLDSMVRLLQERFIQRTRLCHCQRRERQTRFRRKNIPAITLDAYLLRIANYVVALEPVVLLAVLAYAERLDPAIGPQEMMRDRHGEEECATNPSILVIDGRSVHRFVMACVCLASKALGDHYYSNAFYAKVGGVSTGEMTILELELADKLGWKLQCAVDELAHCWKLLEGSMVLVDGRESDGRTLYRKREENLTRNADQEGENKREFTKQDQPHA